VNLILDFIAAGVAGRGTWGLHPEHFAERHGLIVIIALGESLIVAASGLVGAERTPELLLVGGLSVAITCVLWWVYFPVAKPELEGALVAADPDGQGALARDVFSFAHFPILCGVIAYAVAIEGAVAHPGDPLPGTERVALALGLFLFVGGLVLALRRASCRSRGSRLSRIAVSVVTAGAILALTGVNALVSLGIALAGVLVVAVQEEALAGRLVD